jgi:capsular exopolysaccharide synthesis family protein
MQKPRDFSFQIVDIRVAVEAVYRNLTIKRANPGEGINYIAVTLNGRDYELSTLTVNTIADLFIDKNFRFCQQHTHNVVKSLEKQLSISQHNLSTAESKMRNFRLKNPQVGLDQRIQQTIDTLDQLNSDIQHISDDIVIAENFRKSFTKADTAQRLQIAGEMAEFLTARMVPSGSTLKDGLERLIAQKYALLSTYGTENPKVIENNRLTVNMTRLTFAAVNDFIKDAHSSSSRKRDSITYLSNSLLELPVLEMQLGELERNRKIYADIYSTVLADYNRAKVVESVEKSVFYIMDYAAAPLPPPVSLFPLVTICVLISVLLSIGSVFVYDRFDKTVHTQRQLARVTGIAALETIPSFTTKAGKGIRRKLSGRYPLISMPCRPTFTKEIFNTLQLKINLLMSGALEHGIVVSGFESGCGKSLISANLAMAIAMHGHKTLLVDADLRRGMIGKIFNAADSEGLSELLSNTNPLSEEQFEHSLVSTHIPDLYILPSGHEPSNPGALLLSPRMQEFRKFCHNHGSFLVMDSPPISAVGDAVALNKQFAHYIFVVRAGKTNVTRLIDRIDGFGDLRNKILGYVLNGAPESEVGDYQHYFRSGVKNFFVDLPTKKYS